MTSNQLPECAASIDIISEEIIKCNVNTFRHYLETSIVVRDLVRHFELFSREQRNELLQIAKNNPNGATRQALEIIDQLGHPDKYVRLLKILDKADYPKLVGLLKGKLFCANDNYRKRFNEATSCIYQRLNPSEVVPYLQQKGVISSHEAEEIRNIERNKSRSDAALELQYILPNRQRYWYELTIWSLVESNQVELAEIIDSKLTQAIITDPAKPALRSTVSLQSLANFGSVENLTVTDTTLTNASPKPRLPSDATLTNASSKPSLPSDTTLTNASPKPSLPSYTTLTNASPKPSLPSDNTFTNASSKPSLPSDNTFTNASSKPSLPSDNTFTNASPKPILQDCDDNRLRQCKSCGKKGHKQKADNLCEVDQDYPCDNCRDSHVQSTRSEGHNILSEIVLPEKNFFMHAEWPATICICAEEGECQVFCESHKEFVCITCYRLKHPTCKTCTFQEKCVNYSPSDLETILSKTTELKDELENVQQRWHDTLLFLIKTRNECKIEINGYRTDLNNLLDKLQERAFADLRKHEVDLQKAIDEHVQTISSTLELLNKDYETTQDAQSGGIKERMFITDIKVSRALAEYRSVNINATKKIFTPTLNFKRNEQLEAILNQVKSFGDIWVDTPTSSETDIFDEVQFDDMTVRGTNSTSFLDMKILNSREAVVKATDDKAMPFITGSEFMPEGDCVLCDFSNKKVKFLDQHFKLTQSIELQSAPCDVAVVDNQMVVVTVPNKRRLQYIQFFPEMKIGRTINLNLKCWGIEVFANELYVTCHSNLNHSYKGEIRVLDGEGVVKKTIGIDDYGRFMFHRPFYLKINPLNRKLFVSDYGNKPLDPSSLYCLTLDGDVVYKYPNFGSLGTGVSVDEGDNVFICCENSNNVEVVTRTGTWHETLLSEKDHIRQPQCIAVRKKYDTLVVGCCWNENLLVLSLGKAPYSYICA